MNSANNIVKTITNIFSDESSPLPELTTLTNSASTPSITNSVNSAATNVATSVANTSNSIMAFFANITWQTWVIIILILALLGINIFAYLAKGTQTTATLFEQIFNPILKLFGYTILETTKQTITTSAAGTNAGVNIVANTSVSAIDTVEQAAGSSSTYPTYPTYPTATSGTSVGVSTPPPGQMAVSSQQGIPIQNQTEAAIQQYKEDALEKALSSASQTGGEVQPYSMDNNTKSAGKAGWCYIGEDLGVRACSQVGVNDVCMSGDVFPSQEICMNPNLRA